MPEPLCPLSLWRPSSWGGCAQVLHHYFVDYVSVRYRHQLLVSSVSEVMSDVGLKTSSTSPHVLDFWVKRSP
eukprot:2059621-Amphidinium_carterae.1